MSLSLLVPEEKKLPISRKASIPYIYISGAKPKGRNLTPPEVTGEGAFVSGKALLAVGGC